MYYQKTMEFSEWLEMKLKQKGWSRSEAARRGGVSASMYDKVIRDGQEPGMKFLEGVAKAFKMRLADVVEIASNPSARISDEILQQSQEILEDLQYEDTRRKALAELKRLKEEEGRRKNGSAASARSSKSKSS